MRPDPGATAKADAVAAALVGDQVSEERLNLASEFAQAQLELLRIRAMRAELMKIEFGSDLNKLRRLVALDRYERIAHTKRRRAFCKL